MEESFLGNPQPCGFVRPQDAKYFANPDGCRKCTVCSTRSDGCTQIPESVAPAAIAFLKKIFKVTAIPEGESGHGLDPIPDDFFVGVTALDSKWRVPEGSTFRQLFAYRDTFKAGRKDAAYCKAMRDEAVSLRQDLDNAAGNGYAGNESTPLHAGFPHFVDTRTVSRKYSKPKYNKDVAEALAHEISGSTKKRKLSTTAASGLPAQLEKMNASMKILHRRLAAAEPILAHVAADRVKKLKGVSRTRAEGHSAELTLAYGLSSGLSDDEGEL